MTERKLVPHIRFKRFKDQWTIYSFLKLFNIIDGDRGKNYPSGKDFSNIGDVLFLSAANVTKNGFSFFDNQFITKKKSDSMGNGKLIKSDVVLTTRGSVGYVALYDKKTVKKFPAVRINSGMLILRPLRTIKSEFIYQYLFSSSAKKRVKSLSFGSAQPQLTKRDISNFKICRPCVNEQQKIGDLFAKLDRLLDLQQQKLDRLELLKKALLQKLFPKQDAKIPELRFKGFVEEWGDFVLGKIAKFLNGRAYKQSELLEKGKYPVLRVGNFYTNDSWYYSNLQLPEKYYAKKGDLLYTWSATFGPHIWNGSTVIYHYHIWKIELSSLLNKEFTYQLLLEDRSKLLNNTNGSTMIHLTKSEMESKLVKIPNIAEQQKIGNLLAKIDRLIELKNKKFSNLKLVKKSLLQNMFVE